MEIYERIKKDFSYLFILILIVQFFYRIFPIGKDTTDPEKGRSGLSLRIDNMTGCHYLENIKGGILPRLNREGHHICEDR